MPIKYFSCQSVYHRMHQNDTKLCIQYCNMRSKQHLQKFGVKQQNTSMCIRKITNKEFAKETYFALMEFIS